ncbi:hypothetical protein M0R72_20960 [Candidatus Pacearchaeota archaeon]|jgi:hypothetical protein|nr:hypothetical protein [Candidatus Pacearchaeota archaeon]
MQTELFDNPKTGTRSRVEKLLDYAERFGHYIQLVDGCCEPGYDDKPVVLGNWNSETRWDGEKHITVNNIMPRIAKLLEKLGYEIEWEDEWSVCEDCGKAIRAEPDSYSWQPSYATIGDCIIICHDCIKSNPVDYLEELSGNPEKCLTFDIPLDEYGYVMYDCGYEVGWYQGQNANPKKIVKELRAKGITDFIFVMDDVNQFDCEFSVWVKQPE